MNICLLIPFHPRHIKTNVPLNLAGMICSIVENPNTKERLPDLRLWLLKCGYPSNLLTYCIDKHKNESNEDVGTVNFEENDELGNNLAYVLTFNPKNPNIFPELNSSFKFL